MTAPGLNAPTPTPSPRPPSVANVFTRFTRFAPSSPPGKRKHRLIRGLVCLIQAAESLNKAWTFREVVGLEEGKLFGVFPRMNRKVRSF